MKYVAMLALLAFLAVPLVGCKKAEEPVPPAKKAEAAKAEAAKTAEAVKTEAAKTAEAAKTEAAKAVEPAKAAETPK